MSRVTDCPCMPLVGKVLRQTAGCVCESDLTVISADIVGDVATYYYSQFELCTREQKMNQIILLQVPLSVPFFSRIMNTVLTLIAVANVSRVMFMKNAASSSFNYTSILLTTAGFTDYSSGFLGVLPSLLESFCLLVLYTAFSLFCG